MKNTLIAVLLITGISAVYICAQEKSATQEKKITIIRGESTADGKSDVRERLLEECIVSLPRAEDLDAQTTASSQFLKEINGDANRNEFVKFFTASIEINYMVYQKALIIVTTNAIAGQEPVMKVVEKNFKQTKVFESNAASGDLFAGRSNRQYYFSTEEGAVKDAKNRARTWLRQQAAVVCTSKPSEPKQ